MENHPRINRADLVVRVDSYEANKLIKTDRVFCEVDMKITKRDRALMNNKLFQLWRFIVLNLKILKAVDHSKRS